MSDSSISPGVQFQIWNRSDRGGPSDKFTTTQGQDNITANTVSLETAANTWVIVFDSNNYEGCSLQIDPSKYLHELNDVKRYDSNGNEKGDWKNQISSFILYNSQPAYWGRNPSKDELFDPGNGKALITDGTNYLGNNRTFLSPYNALDLHSIGYTTNSQEILRTTGGTIQSIRTGSNAWMVVYDDISCGGCAWKIDPGRKYNDLDEIDRLDADGNKKGDWKNQIASFLIFPTMPEFWGTKYCRPYIDFKSLFQLFPGTTNSNTDDHIEYIIEDATYTVDEPSLELQTTTASLTDYYGNDDFTDLPLDGWTKYHFHAEHHNTAGKNDKVDCDLYFDNGGKLVNIQRFEWSSDGAYSIPQQAIKIVDDEAWVLGTAGAIESLGISEEAADDFIEAFDFICKVFNDVTSLVYKKTDDGGRYYFLPVVCHALNRICTVILNNYKKPTFLSPTDSRNIYMMDYGNDYQTALQNSGLSFSSVSGWEPKPDSSGNPPYNNVIEYQYHGWNFRTWYQETSFAPVLGMLVSCKIDYEIDDHDKDDHIILLMGFRIPPEGSYKPVLNFVQATIQFTDDSNTNIMTKQCNSGDIIEDAYNQLSQGLVGVDASGNKGGRQYLADIAKANMNAMVSCATFIHQ